MKKSKLPKTDSIEKLAVFWDAHDLTNFEDELEEVAEPVFVRGSAIRVHLAAREVEALEQMAQAKGVSREELIRAWVLQKLARRNNSRQTAIKQIQKGGGISNDKFWREIAQSRRAKRPAPSRGKK